MTNDFYSTISRVESTVLSTERYFTIRRTPASTRQKNVRKFLRCLQYNSVLFSTSADCSSRWCSNSCPRLQKHHHHQCWNTIRIVMSESNKKMLTIQCSWCCHLFGWNSTCSFQILRNQWGLHSCCLYCTDEHRTREPWMSAIKISSTIILNSAVFLYLSLTSIE
jgi:hypothetical protein